MCVQIINFQVKMSKNKVVRGILSFDKKASCRCTYSDREIKTASTVNSIAATHRAPRNGQKGITVTRAFWISNQARHPPYRNRVSKRRPTATETPPDPIIQGKGVGTGG